MPGEVPYFVKYADALRDEKERFLIPLALSLDDVILVPGKSVVRSTGLDEVSTQTELVKGFPLAIPIISANMDSVTEAPMAEFMARVGGIGILHRAMPIEEMVRQVAAVKDATKYIVEDPPIVFPNDTVGRARQLMKDRGRGFAAIVTDGNKLLGLITSRDAPEEVPDESIVTGLNPWGGLIMTPREELIVAPPGIDLKTAFALILANKVEKLPLVDEEDNLVGVITQRDIKTLESFPLATKDEKGRLRVGVAVGVDPKDYPERIAEAVKAGADILCVDVLHGDSPAVYDVIRYIQAHYPGIKIIAGNVGDSKSTKNLAQAGADAVKVGYGDGALCTTQVETGFGRKQATAIADSSAVVYGEDTAIIADGGIRNGGHITKSLALGAKTVMIGTELAGTEQAPGKPKTDPLSKEQYVEIRGMASEGANDALAQAKGKAIKKRAPQGITARVVYRGDAGPLIEHWMDYLRHGIANSGGRNIAELQLLADFERQTRSGVQEGQPHVIFNGGRR